MSLQPYDGSRTHPARAARDAAVTSGYELAAEEETDPIINDPPTGVTEGPTALVQLPASNGIIITVPSQGPRMITGTLPSTNATLEFSSGLTGSALAGPVDYSGDTKWSWKTDERGRKVLHGVSYFPGVGVMVVTEFHTYPAVGTLINFGFSFSPDTHLLRVDDVVRFAYRGRELEIDGDAIKIGTNQYRIATSAPIEDTRIAFVPVFDNSQFATITLGTNVEVQDVLADAMRQ